MTLITAEGTAEEKVPAETATITFNILYPAHTEQAALDSAAQAVSVLATRAKRLRDEGKASDHSVSTIAARFVASDARIAKYSASATVSIVVTDLTLVGELTNEFGGISSRVNWALRPETRAAVARQVRVAAILDARERAEDYAAALGMVIADTVEVRDSSGGGYALARSAALGSVRDEAAAEVTFPEIAIRASATVQFAATAARLG